MHTDIDSELEAFAVEIDAFFGARWPDRSTHPVVWGEGSDDVALFPTRTVAEEAADVAAAKRWRAEVFDHGYGWLSGPEAYGGRGLSDDHERVFQQVAARFAVPDQTCFSLSLGMVSPTLLAHGSAAAKARHLRALRRGDRIACQLFSEPEAGSDLASLQTAARRDGTGWRLDGQKVWTSRAHVADLGLCLARTGDPADRHRSLTCFVVDMAAPGVEVRPLRQMTGGAVFNEVFLDNVRVEDDERVGAVDRGWDAAITTLMNERARIGGGDGGVAQLDEDRLRALIHHHDRAGDPIVRQQIVDLICRDRLATWTADRIRQASPEPGPELSLAKILRTGVVVDTARFVSTIVGPGLVADTGEWGAFAWSQLVLGAPGLRLGGGTDEVLRNVLAERVLGLPR